MNTSKRAVPATRCWFQERENQLLTSEHWYPQPQQRRDWGLSHFLGFRHESPRKELKCGALPVHDSACITSRRWCATTCSGLRNMRSRHIQYQSFYISNNSIRLWYIEIIKIWQFYSNYERNIVKLFRLWITQWQIYKIFASQKLCHRAICCESIYLIENIGFFWKALGSLNLH